MAYSSKPKFVEVAPPKGRSVVYYLGAHPHKGLALPGAADYPIKDGAKQFDKAEFVADGMVAYDFERVDPASKTRYALCDLPQHLLFFAVHVDGENTHPYKVKPTPNHKKVLGKLQALYIVDNATGALKLRKDVAQMEADLDALLSE